MADEEGVIPVLGAVKLRVAGEARQHIRAEAREERVLIVEEIARGRHADNSDNGDERKRFLGQVAEQQALRRDDEGELARLRQGDGCHERWPGLVAEKRGDEENNERLEHPDSGEEEEQGENAL